MNENKKPKLKHILEYKDYSEHLDNLKYYQNEYIKNKHEGAEYCCVLLEPSIKIYGLSETDSTKDESGKPHFHIVTDLGETEFYFTIKPYTISYKDGLKMLKKDEEALHKKLLTECEISKGSPYYNIIYNAWYFENKNNSKTN